MTTAIASLPKPAAAAAATAPPLPDAAAPAPDAGIQPLPLLGRLHLNLSALGVDPNAPDFGERLCRLSQDNPPYDFEFSAQGELIIMAPSGWESNIGEKGVNAPLFFWSLDNAGVDCS